MDWHIWLLILFAFIIAFGAGYMVNSLRCKGCRDIIYKQDKK
jgi:hypothetical protein